MKLYTYNTKQLAATLAILSSIKQDKKLPLCNNIFIQANPDGLTFQRLDLEQFITHGAKPTAADWFSIDAKQLHALVKAQTANEITLTAEGETLTLNGRKLPTEIRKDADIPAPLKPSGDGQLLADFTLNHAWLAQYLPALTASMPLDDTRFYLNGVLFRFDVGTLALISSDGHRLTQAKAPNNILQNGGDIDGGKFDIILPALAIKTLARMVKLKKAIRITARGETGHDCRVYVNPVDTDQTLDVRAIDSKYPDFSKVYDQKVNREITVSTPALVNALTEIKPLFKNEKYQGVKLTYDRGLKISIPTGDYDLTVMDARERNVKSMNVGVNLIYLLDALKTAPKSEATTLQFLGDDSAILMQQNGLYQLVMPMRL